MMAPQAEERVANSEANSPPEKLILTPSPSAKSTTDPLPPQKFQPSVVYKSELVYKPSDDPHQGKHFEGGDVEAHSEEKGIWQDPISAKRDRQRRTYIVCCFSLWYVIFILILVGGIAVIKLTPKDPAVSFGGVSVTEFVYKESDNGSPQIEAALSCLLNVTNRNPRATAFYEEIKLSVSFQGDSLGNFRASPAPSFEQKRHTTTSIVETMPKTLTTITNKANADLLRSEVSNSNVQLGVTGFVKGKSRVFGIKVKKFNIGVLCTLNVRPGDGASRAAAALSVSCYVSK